MKYTYMYMYLITAQRSKGFMFYNCVIIIIIQDIITHKFKMDEVEKGLNMVSNSKESIKIVLLPSWD